MAALSSSLGYSNDIQLTHYDPIQAAGDGDENAKQILVAGSLIANLIKQSEAFASLSPSQEVGALGLAVVKQLGYAVMVSDANLTSSMIDSSFMKAVLESALLEVGENTSLAAFSVSDFALIAATSNQAIAQIDISSLLPGEVAVKLAKVELAVEVDILDEYEKVRDGLASLTSLAGTLSAGSLVTTGDSFVGVNLYAPVGNSFDLSIDQNDWVANKVLTTLFVSDADGDAVSLSIISGNEDVDGDGNFPFVISQSMELLAGDINDLESLNDLVITLKISLSDGNGKEGSITGTITNGTVEDQDEQIIDDQTGEVAGSTSSTEQTALSIESSDDSSGAIVSNDQLVSNISITSGNADLDGDGQYAFKISDSNEITIGDLDDLKQMSASEIKVTLEGIIPNGSEVVLERTLNIDNALSLESARLHTNNWMTSEWFGNFYSTGSPWIYHAQLGWLYVLPDSKDGFWFWDTFLNSWWWSRSDSHPYAFNDNGNESGWIFLQFNSDAVHVFDFNSQRWSTRP